MPKITRKMLEEARHKNCSVVGRFRAYCDLNSCCDECDKFVRFLCKVKNSLEEVQTKRILKICKEESEEQSNGS